MILDPEMRRCVAWPGLVVERTWSWLQWCGWFAAWSRWGHLTESPRMGLGSLMGAGISNDEKVRCGGREGCSGPRTYIYVRTCGVFVRQHWVYCTQSFQWSMGRARLAASGRDGLQKYCVLMPHR